MKALLNRSVFVTGPAKGMGIAISLALARSGADLVLAGRDISAIEDVAEKVEAMGQAACVQQCDVTDDDSVASAVNRGRAAIGGRLDGLVCVAGIAGPSGKTLWQSTVEDYRRVFDVNVLGIILAMRHVLPHLINQESGSVVNIGGTYGFRGAPFDSLYAGTKWAVRGLTKSAALEAGPHGVRVNCVCPGGVDGPRLRRQLTERAEQENRTFQEAYDRFCASTALGRVSSPADVAESVVFLLSDAARNITGQDLVVDGGTII